MGETIDEAKNNALRSAIEQSFGAFISSKTEIFNDDIKDEIVSISNGSIHNYKIISQVEVPEAGYAITLEATISLSQLSTFVQSKGIEVEFKGGIFAANIKQQKLNEDAEIKALINLLEVSESILSKSLDFSLETTEPKFLQESIRVSHYDLNYNQYDSRVNYKDYERYALDLKVNISYNTNLDIFKDYFISTIESIAMADDEIISYTDLKKPIYNFEITGFANSKKYYTDKEIKDARKHKDWREIRKIMLKESADAENPLKKVYFRNSLSVVLFSSFFNDINKFLTNFTIVSDIDTIIIKNPCGQKYKSDCLYKVRPSFYKESISYQNEIFKDDHSNISYQLNVVEKEQHLYAASQVYIPAFNFTQINWDDLNSTLGNVGMLGFTGGIVNYSVSNPNVIPSTWTNYMTGLGQRNKKKLSNRDDYSLNNGVSMKIGRLDFTKKKFLHIIKIKYTLDEIQRINEFKIKKSSFVKSHSKVISNKITDEPDLLIGEINDPDGYTNFRKGPNSKSQIIKKIYEKSNFIILDTTDRWWYIKHDNNTGYIHKSRVKIVSD